MALAACDLSDRLTRQGEVIHDRLNHLEWQACSLGSQWQEGKGCVGTPALLTLLEAKDEAAVMIALFVAIAKKVSGC